MQQSPDDPPPPAKKKRQRVIGKGYETFTLSMSGPSLMEMAAAINARRSNKPFVIKRRRR